MPLLADQILAKGLVQHKATDRAIQDAIRAAHAFDMDGDFGAAADQLRSSRPSSFRNVLPLCRLPYESCWFEVSQRVRSGFVNGTTHWTQDPAALDRVGVLVNEARDAPGQWELTLFWSFVDGRLSMSHFDSLISFEDTPRFVGVHPPAPRSVLETRYRGKELDAADSLFSRMAMRPGRFSARAFEQAPLGSPMYRTLFELADNDWGGECTFWMAAVALLNARNVVDREEVDNAERNRRRLRAGSKRPPLLSYTRCLISARLRERMAEAGANGGGEAAVRAHFVRGHLKARETGIFWWSPFIRGDKRLGFVRKEYEVEGAPPGP